MVIGKLAYLDQALSFLFETLLKPRVYVRFPTYPIRLGTNLAKTRWNCRFKYSESERTTVEILNEISNESFLQKVNIRNIQLGSGLIDATEFNFVFGTRILKYVLQCF